MQIQLTMGSGEAAKNCGDGMAVALTAAACRDNGSSMEVEATRIRGESLWLLPQVLHKNFCPPKKSKNETYERRYLLNWTTGRQRSTKKQKNDRHPPHAAPLLSLQRGSAWRCLLLHRTQIPRRS
jgi:hypothetical protein